MAEIALGVQVVCEDCDNQFVVFPEALKKEIFVLCPRCNHSQRVQVNIEFGNVKPDVI